MGRDILEKVSYFLDVFHKHISAPYQLHQLNIVLRYLTGQTRCILELKHYDFYGEI